MRRTPSCTAPILRERAVAAAVLHRRPRFEPVDADRVERELEHAVSAPSWNTPVPQNAEPMAKPHSAVSNPGSLARTWKIPIAVSKPLSVTAKQA